MRVVCAYAHLQAPTRAALEAQSDATEFADVSSSEVAYFELLRDVWRTGEDALAVEHDIEIAPGTVAALEACPREWCSCPINGMTAAGWGAAALQCNRWRGELMRAHPSLLDDVPEQRRAWWYLDSAMLPALHKRGARVHVHYDLPTTHHATWREQIPGWRDDFYSNRVAGWIRAHGHA
jgi:hypothetical protein